MVRRRSQPGAAYWRGCSMRSRAKCRCLMLPI